jgi:hypothetical protein
MTDCRPMNGFAFVEFESSRVINPIDEEVDLLTGQDAEDCMRDWNGKEFQGDKCVDCPACALTVASLSSHPRIPVGESSILIRKSDPSA